MWRKDWKNTPLNKMSRGTSRLSDPHKTGKCPHSVKGTFYLLPQVSSITALSDEGKWQRRTSYSVDAWLSWSYLQLSPWSGSALPAWLSAIFISSTTVSSTVGSKQNYFRDRVSRNIRAENPSWCSFYSSHIYRRWEVKRCSPFL